MNPAVSFFSAEVQRELLTVTAQELWLHTGFDAVSGFPLPDGSLPVGTKALGMVLICPKEWESYRSLCAFHRAVNPATAAAA